MNTDEIIKFAKRAGFYIPTPIDIRTQDLFMPKLEHFAKLIIEVERESCAKIVEEQWIRYKELEAAHYRQTPEPFNPSRYYKDLSQIFFSRDMAETIRTRGDK
jgi:hypothetical protein